MSLVEHGSVEIITGQGSISTGKLFGPEDDFDDEDVAGSVKRISGATVGAPQANPYGESCIGVYAGTDANKNAATIKVWRLQG